MSKRKKVIKVKTDKLPDEVYREALKQGFAYMVKEKLAIPEAYVLLTLQMDGGNIMAECYGPFASAKEAHKQARYVKRPCLKLVEFMWGKVKS